MKKRKNTPTRTRKTIASMKAVVTISDDEMTAQMSPKDAAAFAKDIMAGVDQGDEFCLLFDAEQQTLTLAAV